MYQKLNAELKSREFGILEIFFNSAKVFLKIFPALLIINAFLLFPVGFILEIFVPAYKPIEDYTLLIIVRYGVFIAVCFQIPAYNAIRIIANQYLTEGKINLWASIRKGFSKWGDFFGTSTLMGAIAFFWFLFFIIPGLIFIVRLYFIGEAVVLRDLRGKSAISYSKSLVAGRWWKVFLTLLSVLINNYFLIFIFATICAFITLIPLIGFTAGFVYRFISGFLTCFAFIVSTLYFVNLEYRKA